MSATIYKSTFSFLLIILLAGIGTISASPLTAPAATPNSITLNWTAPGDDGTDGSASQYDIRYSLSTITDLNWNSAMQAVGEPTPQSAGSSESFEVSGLQPSTTYYFAIKAADEVPNWSGMSNVIIKSTEAETTAPSAIANLTTGTVTNGSIVVNWTAPGDDGASGTASEYDIRYSTSTITDLNWASATQATGEPAPQIAGSSQSFTASGLSANTTYYFAIKTADEVPNWSGLSNIANGTTSEDPTVPDPPVLAAPDNGETGLTDPIGLSWFDIAGVDEFQVQVATNIALVNPLRDTTTGDTAYSASGFDEGTIHYWRVRAHNQYGWSAWSSVRNFTTNCPTPSAPQLVSPTNGSPSGVPVSLNWNDIADVSQYQIQIDQTSDFSSTVVNSSVTVSNYTAASLTEGQLYYWRVRAINSCGWSAWSATWSFNAADTSAPAAIDDLSAETGGADGTINMGWTAPGDDIDHGIVSAYLIKCSEEYLDDDTWDSAVVYEEFVTPVPAGQYQSVVMSGLVPGREYYVAIKAYDEAANGSPLSNTASAVAGYDIVLDVDDEVASLAGPENGIQLHSSKPVLAVHNLTSQGDNQYYFEVAADSFFINVVAISPPIPQQGGDVTSWKVDQKLETGDLYFWRARANDFEYSELATFSVFAKAHAYPNPFRPEEDAQVTFTEIPDGSSVVLISVSGTTIREWSDVDSDNFYWDGSNEAGEKVSSGTYLWFVENSAQKGKIVVKN